MFLLWTCQYCGSEYGMYYKDQQLEGMLCLDPNCGRFNDLNEKEKKDFYDSDL